MWPASRVLHEALASWPDKQIGTPSIVMMLVVAGISMHAPRESCRVVTHGWVVVCVCRSLPGLGLAHRRNPRPPPPPNGRPCNLLAHILPGGTHQKASKNSSNFLESDDLEMRLSNLMGSSSPSLNQNQITSLLLIEIIHSCFLLAYVLPCFPPACVLDASCLFPACFLLASCLLLPCFLLCFEGISDFRHPGPNAQEGSSARENLRQIFGRSLSGA